MLDVLYKKAKGYEVTEVTKEYGMDEEGNPKLVKEKTATKYVPPDLSAIKAYMELKDASLFAMSEQDLLKEKRKLLRELKNGKKESNEEKSK